MEDLQAEAGPADACGDAPRYFPPSNGLYEVEAGFCGLRSRFGNGAMDGRVFQLDGQFARYRQTLHFDERLNLTAAIESMTPASLEYKGLRRTKEAVVEWLRRGA